MAGRRPASALSRYFAAFSRTQSRSLPWHDSGYDKLRLHAHELWLRALLATYYTFGFRRSELLRLRVRQINLIDRTINLPAGATKNGKARRVVMTAEVLALVTALIQGKQPTTLSSRTTTAPQ